MDRDDERAPRREESERGVRPGSPEGAPGPRPPLPPGGAAGSGAAGKGGSGAAGSGGGALAVGGFEFAAVLLAFVFLGQWLDRRLDTAPVFLLVCVFVGFAGATFSMYRRLTAAQQREDAARRRRE